MSNCGKWRRLLKKRELLAYYILCREKGIKWNIGEAVDHLMNNLLLRRKTVFSILKRFKRMGLLIQIDNLTYSCYGFNEYIEELLKNYVCRKKQRPCQ